MAKRLVDETSLHSLLDRRIQVLRMAETQVTEMKNNKIKMTIHFIRFNLLHQFSLDMTSTICKFVASLIWT